MDRSVCTVPPGSEVWMRTGVCLSREAWLSVCRRSPIAYWAWASTHCTRRMGVLTRSRPHARTQTLVNIYVHTRTHKRPLYAWLIFKSISMRMVGDEIAGSKCQVVERHWKTQYCLFIRLPVCFSDCLSACQSAEVESNELQLPSS